MKLKVTFRSYTPPDIDPETGHKERGEFIESFSATIEGRTPGEILEIADQKAKDYSARYDLDVRVWETVVTVTPRGIISL